MIYELLQDHISRFSKQKEELILRVYKKQKEFVSYEASKHLIGLNCIYREGDHLGDDYLFNGKVILTIYPHEFTQEDGKFTIKFNYAEH